MFCSSGSCHLRRLGGKYKEPTWSCSGTRVFMTTNHITHVHQNMYIYIYFLNLVNWNPKPWRFWFSWSSISWNIHEWEIYQEGPWLHTYQIGTCDSAIKSYDFTRRWRNPVKIIWINYQTRPDWFQPWYHPPSLPSKFQVAKFFGFRGVWILESKKCHKDSLRPLNVDNSWLIWDHIRLDHRRFGAPVNRATFDHQ